MTNSDTKNFSQNVSSSYHLEDRGKNVPKLRFKGYNDELITVKLNKLFSKIKEKNSNGNITNVICNSAKLGLIPQREYFDKDIANIDNTLGYYVIKNNDFVYNPRKSKDAPYGPIGIYEYSEIGIVSPLYLVFRKIMDIDTNFFKYYFLSNAWHRYVYLEGDSGARHDRVSIKDNVFFDMPVKIPSLQEQEKIASFLTLIDKKIEKQKELVELLKKYKRGLLSAIFSQKLRFKDNNGNNYPAWEEKYIQDVCSITTGKGNTQDKEENGIYPLYVRSPIVEKSNKYIYDGEAVLTVGDGVGTGKVFHYVNGKFNFHQRVYKMSNFSGINGRYFYYYFSTHFYDRVKRMTAKTSVDSVRMDMIAKMSIFIPTNEEQDKIINLLTNIENIFLKNENQLLLLQEYKKGLLQQLFI